MDFRTPLSTRKRWKSKFVLFSFLCRPAPSGADQQELATPILSHVCHGIFTDWSIFSTPFLLWKKGSSGPVTQWRQLVSCDWLWHSHGSFIQSRFDLKINRCMKTPWQENSWVACSYTQAPATIESFKTEKRSIPSVTWQQNPGTLFPTITTFFRFQLFLSTDVHSHFCWEQMSEF